MSKISSIAELEQLYDAPVSRSLTKVTSVITPLYKQWIESSRFLIISTVGEDGCDGSPRGDMDNLIKIQDEKTILLPDWKGNNRLDTLRNIVTDGRASLLFMANGCGNVVRINGTAELTSDVQMREAFGRKDRLPKTVIVFRVGEMYFQCAKAIMRSELWNSANGNNKLPTAGDLLKEQEASFDASTYDANYVENSKDRMW